MRNNIIHIAAIALCVLVSACNNDIFTDVSDLPEYTDIMLEGDGGEWSSAFSRKGLTRIHIDYSPEEKEYISYYDSNGNPTDSDCPASELGSIVYENPKLWYSIGFVGDMIYIRSNYNASSDTEFSLQLDYESGETKNIKVNISEGENLQFIFWTPRGDLKLDEDIDRVTHTTSLTNNSSLSQKMEIMPFLDSRCTDMAMPADYWARGLTVDMPMLTFNGSEWYWNEYHDIVLGRQRTFTPSRYLNTKITVDVPAYTKAKVTYTLYYTRATQDAEITFYNSVQELTYDVPVCFTSVYATRFEYNVAYE